MVSCIVGALLCGAHSANMLIAGPLAYAPPNNANWGYPVYVQPLQFQPPIIIRRA